MFRKKFLSFFSPIISFFLYLWAFVKPVLAVDPSPVGGPPAGLLQLQELAQRFINLTVELGFVFMIFLMLWGGIKYIASGGEAKAVEEANGIMTWAAVGAIFLIVAFLILKVVSAITGVDVTQFCLGFPNSSTHCGN